MSILISHAKGISKVKYFANNRSYLLPYPCSTPSTCSQYTITFNPGIYLLEVWGSQRSDVSGYSGKGGSGGYSAGIFRTFNKTNLYLHVGAFSPDSDGYNGGPNSKNSCDGRGGGATDFRSISGAWNEHFDSRIIVAGSGGGAFENNHGGRGSGLTGESISADGKKACYGTQKGCEGTTTGYDKGSKGKGGGSGAGTGGSGYWGGGNTFNGGGGGGGSGYIGGVISLPYFEKVTSFSDHKGYGEARITIIGSIEKHTTKIVCNNFLFSLLILLIPANCRN